MKLSRRLFLSGVCAAALIGPTDARFPHGGGPVSPTFAQVRIGGGGYIIGMDVAADGTMAAQVDVFGAYICNGTGPWSQLVTTNSMPSSLVGLSGVHTLLNDGGLGVYALRIAATNTNILYMFIANAVLVSSNRGVTWTNMTNWPSGSISWATDANSGGGRLLQKKMAIDPINAAIVFIGTPANGLYKTLNGTSGATATFSSVVGVPNSGANRNGVRGIVFDSSHTSGGATQYIYAATDAGVYASTDGGLNWTLTTGSPVNVTDAMVSGGVLYCSTNYTVAGGLWSYTGGLAGTWTRILTDANGCASAAVNPFNTAWMVGLTNGGAYIQQSGNTGSTWTGDYSFEGGNPNNPPSDAGWIADTLPGYPSSFSSANNPVAVSVWFDPVVANRIWRAWGYGVSYYDMSASNLSTSTQLAWVTHVAGMELMVTRHIVSQPSYSPIIAFEDQQVFRITDPTTYPAGSGSTTPAYGLGARNRNSAAWGLDGSLSTNGVLAVLSTGYYVGLTGGNYSAYSTNGGASWTLFPVPPTVCNCTGSISGTTLTVSAIASGTLGQNMTIQSGTAAGFYISGAQLTGTPGGVGTYPVPAGTPAVASGALTFIIDGGAITCTDATHFAAVSASLLCKPVYTTNAGTTWLPCTGLPVASYISNGNKFDNCAILTNDAGGNMYLYLGGGGANGGTYRSTDGGANWSRVNTTDLTAPIFYQPTIRAVPGLAGNLFFALGNGSNTGSFYFSNNGTGTMTWAAVSNVQDVFAFGFGAAAGGGFTSPTLWLIGWVNKGGAGYQFGVWKSRDLGVSDWTMYTDFPIGNPDVPCCISGDANDATKCYIGYQGTSAVYGRNLI